MPRRVRPLAAIAQQRALERAVDAELGAAARKVRHALDALADEVTEAAVAEEMRAVAKARRPPAVAIPTRRVELTITETLKDGLKIGRNLAAGHLPPTLEGQAATARRLAAVERAQAAKWAERRAATLVKGVSSSARKAIRTAVTEGIKAGSSPATVASQIRSQIRLDERGAKAVKNFRAAQEANGVRAELIERRAAAYADRLVKRRAELIANAEMRISANEGRKELWRSLVDEGIVKQRQIQRTWVTQQDDSVDPICEDLDGETAPLNGSFPGGAEPGAVHPACRCTSFFEVVGA